MFRYGEDLASRQMALGRAADAAMSGVLIRTLSVVADVIRPLTDEHRAGAIGSELGLLPARVEVDSEAYRRWRNVSAKWGVR